MEQVCSSSSALARVTPLGCPMMKILTNNLSCIGFVFGVGHGVDLRHRGILANINEYLHLDIIHSTLTGIEDLEGQEEPWDHIVLTREATLFHSISIPL